MINHKKYYLVKYHSDSTHTYVEVEIRKTLELLIDNIYVVVGVQIFKQSVGIPMKMCPFVSGPVLFSYWAEFIQKLLHEKKNHLLFRPIRHCDISTKFYLLTIINSIHMSIRYIQINWKSKTPQSVLHLLRIQMYYKKCTVVSFSCHSSNFYGRP
jgi:hypothetical protein